MTDLTTLSIADAPFSHLAVVARCTLFRLHLKDKSVNLADPNDVTRCDRCSAIRTRTPWRSAHEHNPIRIDRYDGLAHLPNKACAPNRWG